LGVSLKNILKDKIIPLMSLAVFLSIWETAARFQIIRPLYIGQPSKILVELINFFSSGKIFPDLVSSMQALVFGFIISIIFGITLGLLVGMYKNFYKLLSPYIFSIYVLPPIAIMPLIIIWFGIGFNAKLAIIILMSVVPILVATSDSVKAIDKKYIEMSNSFEASDVFFLKNIALPFSLPAIFSGIRIAAGRAVIGVVLAEFLGAGTGIGYLISFYGATLQTNKLIAVILVIFILNYLLLLIIEKARKRFLAWQNI
jgi:NitT/TauT family transport system permease protein